MWESNDAFLILFLILVVLFIFFVYLGFRARKKEIEIPTTIEEPPGSYQEELFPVAVQLESKKVELVMTCVNYGDFLAWTLPAARNLFDRTIIVTSPNDIRTKRICEHYHVQCVETDVWFSEGNIFNKAKGINIGLKNLDLDGWVIHMDADIVLPPRTRNVLELLKLDRSCIYGIDRLECIGFKNWIDYFIDPIPMHEKQTFVHLQPFQTGSRICHFNSGYIPIGYFQLWHPRNSGVKEYPEVHGAADRTDVLFALKWSREQRRLLPEIVGIHLCSDAREMGANWHGRTTKEFKPE